MLVGTVLEGSTWNISEDETIAGGQVECFCG